MGKLHELLAAEKTVVSAAEKLMTETAAKFGKMAFFDGIEKSLKMLVDSPENKAIEAAGSESRDPATTVLATLEYALAYWARAEDVLFQKNVTNQRAQASIEFRGAVIATEIPVDELLGLEVRLAKLRNVCEQMPTLPAALRWEPDTKSKHKGAWTQPQAETTTKTQKVMQPVVLYAATKEHPAQVKEASADITVGAFQTIKTCGAATSRQKAEVLATLDELIVEVRKARMRANEIDAVTVKIGEKFASLILAPFQNTSD